MSDPDAEYAWQVLKGKFNPNEPARLISGCAITFNVANSRGRLLEARGLTDLKLPLPLLLEHDWTQPCGRVTDVRVSIGELRFTAEVVNVKAFYLAQVWDKILSLEAVGVSATTPSLDETSAGKFTRWRLEEISIVGSPADGGASIKRVWEVAAVVHLHRPSVTVHWDVPAL